MSEQSTILSNGVKLPIWAIFGAEVSGAIFELRWMVAATVILTFIDFYWGSRESLLHGDHWHFSRAGRRTFSKIVEYLTYLLLGCVIGFSITEPLGICSHVVTSAIGLGFGCLFDVNSIVGHVLAVKGIEVKFNVWKFVFGLIQSKKAEVGEAINNAIEKGEEQ